MYLAYSTKTIKYTLRCVHYNSTINSRTKKQGNKHTLTRTSHSCTMSRPKSIKGPHRKQKRTTA